MSKERDHSDGEVRKNAEWYRKYTSLMIADQVVREYVSVTGNDALTKQILDTVTDAIEAQKVVLEPSDVARAQAEVQVQDSLKDKDLTGEQYRGAATSLRGLVRKYEDVKALPLKPVYTFIENRAQDADARQEYLETKAVHEAQVGQQLQATQYGEYLQRRERRLNVGVALTQIAASVGMLGALASGGALLYEWHQATSLPGYASSGTRAQDEALLQTAQNDLRIRPAGVYKEKVNGKRVPVYEPETLPNNVGAWKALGKVQHDMRGAPQDVVTPILAARHDLAHFPVQDRIIDIFRQDKAIMASEIDRIRALGTSPAAIRFNEDSRRQLEALGTGITLFMAGAGGESKNGQLRHRRKKLRKQIHRHYTR